MKAQAIKRCAGFCIGTKEHEERPSDKKRKKSTDTHGLVSLKQQH